MVGGMVGGRGGTGGGMVKTKQAPRRNVDGASAVKIDPVVADEHRYLNEQERADIHEREIDGLLERQWEELIERGAPGAQNAMIDADPDAKLFAQMIRCSTYKGSDTLEGAASKWIDAGRKHYIDDPLNRSAAERELGVIDEPDPQP